MAAKAHLFLDRQTAHERFELRPFRPVAHDREFVARPEAGGEGPQHDFEVLLGHETRKRQEAIAMAAPLNAGDRQETVIARLGERRIVDGRDTMCPH